MNTFIIVDDDISVRRVITRIIEQYNLGFVTAEAENGITGEQLIVKNRPDIVIVDLLLPLQDGITIVSKLKALNMNTVFIMISQVTSKDMVAKAYESGIEFFINKPINFIEVVNVIKKVKEYITLRKTFETIENTASLMKYPKVNIVNSIDAVKKTLQQIFIDLGILGELGGKDIVNLCMIMTENKSMKENIENMQINDMLKIISQSYNEDGSISNLDIKTLEMRIRRTISKAMKYIASMGIEDYSNEKFILYSSSLFDYSEIKNVMDFIRGKSKVSGKVNLKTFIKRLIVLTEYND